MFKFINLNTEYGEVFPNYIPIHSYSKANMYMVTLKGMVSQSVASEAMISQFCKLARYFYPKNINDIDDFEKLFLSDINSEQPR